MTVMSWNIRGLGKPEKRAAARKLVKKQKISLLLLQETKISKDRSCHSGDLGVMQM